MKRGRMQCKDIPDEIVLQAITSTTGKHPATIWHMWDDVLPQFDLLMPGVPRPLLYAKIDRMARAGLVHACVHRPYGDGQCRGDVHLPEKCRGC